MEYWTIILSILAGTLVIYYYFSSCKRSNDLEQHGIPYIRPQFVQTLWQLFVRPKSFATSIQELYNFYPDAKYTGLFNFSKLVVVMRDLELIKSIGIKNFDSFQDHLFFGSESTNRDPLFGKNLVALRGDQWRDIRTLLSPSFTSSKMRAMFQLMSECAVNFSEYLIKAPTDKQIVEMRDIFTRYTTDVIATCAFGISVDSMKDPDNDFYTFGAKVTNFDTIALIKILLSQHMPWLMRLLNLKMINECTNAFFINLIADTIKIRDEKNIIRPDMIQLMMDSRGKREGKELTIVDMTSQAFIFLLGGFDSSSTLMSFLAYEIAVNPHIQEKLQNEIDKVLEDTNGQLSYEAINEMVYLNATINETLRMHPVQALTDRLCTKDFELPPTLPGAKPYVVKAGTQIWIPFYGLQHDPKYFPEPEKFRPERFLDENRENKCNLNAYYPFGLGPRMCIGNRFALLETKVMLFHLLARCDLKPCEKTPMPLKLQKGGFAMRAEGGFWMSVVPRENQYSM
ncbi:cytochrome P450 9e2-like [Camponotus floridanus]|uniref:cytochrome P450 9e2-like n=1 Tax=Camponotus floridanus TaxID=104421 RepID=UPI000DC66F13|nr:cytochrome P450 9e2-like [Camponotus floridanus]